MHSTTYTLCTLTRQATHSTLRRMSNTVRSILQLADLLTPTTPRIIRPQITLLLCTCCTSLLHRTLLWFCRHSNMLAASIAVLHTLARIAAQVAAHFAEGIAAPSCAQVVAQSDQQSAVPIAAQARHNFLYTLHNYQLPTPYTKRNLTPATYTCPHLLHSFCSLLPRSCQLPFQRRNPRGANC